MTMFPCQIAFAENLHETQGEYRCDCMLADVHMGFTQGKPSEKYLDRYLHESCKEYCSYLKEKYRRDNELTEEEKAVLERYPDEASSMPLKQFAQSLLRWEEQDKFWNAKKASKLNLK